MSVDAILDAVRALPPNEPRLVVEKIREEFDPPLSEAEKEHTERDWRRTTRIPTA